MHKSHTERLDNINFINLWDQCNPNARLSILCTDVVIKSCVVQLFVTNKSMDYITYTRKNSERVRRLSERVLPEYMLHFTAYFQTCHMTSNTRIKCTQAMTQQLSESLRDTHRSLTSEFSLLACELAFKRVMDT